MTAPKVERIYPARVLRVIDGDTYEMDADLGFYSHEYVHIRLRGANCPEPSTPEGETAAKFVSQLFNQVDDRVIVRTKKVPVRSFERYIGEVWLAEPDGRNLADLLIAAGHARPEGDT